MKNVSERSLATAGDAMIGGGPLAKAQSEIYDR
jgi:hypothetical protein